MVVSGILNHIPEIVAETKSHLVSVVFTLPAPRSSLDKQSSRPPPGAGAEISLDKESSRLGHLDTPCPGAEAGQSEPNQ